MATNNKILVVVLVSLLTVILAGHTSALAATSPTLSDSASYSVLGGETVTNTGATTMPGNLGVSPGSAATGFPPGVVGPPGTIHKADTNAGLAQIDNTAAFGTLDQGCDTTYIGASKDLVGENLVPGVYCADAFTLSGTLTLSGTGVWIFKSAATLITSGTANIVGGDSCNVWWRVVSSATLGTNTSLIGNILASTSITLQTGASLNGRAMAQTGSVTLDTNTISGLSCLASPATLRVVKAVTNDNSGTAAASAFNLHVKLAGTDVTNSPLHGVISPGRSYSLFAGTYVVSEDDYSGYSAFYSGDCEANGSVTLTAGADRTCTVTNNDTASAAAALATLHVVKDVNNYNGGTAGASLFSLHVKPSGSTTDVSGSPAYGVTSPGRTYLLSAGTYDVSEDPYGNYVSSFSGGCNDRGSVTLSAGEEKTCTVTNNDIAVATNTSLTSVSSVSPKLPNSGFAPRENKYPRCSFRL